MTVFATIGLEANLAGTAYTDITSDYRAGDKIRIERGIRGNSPVDRTASTGTMSFVMDNSQYNSAGTIGWYSPDNASVRSGWGLGIKTGLNLTYGGFSYPKFLGKIDRINPAFGQYRERNVGVEAVDYMDELAMHKIGMITAQTDKRGDELLAAVVATMPNAPAGTAFDTGSDVYSYGLHSEKDETTTGMMAAQKIAQSGMDDIFVDGGGTLVYCSRHGRLLKIALTSENFPVATFSNTMTGLTIKRGRESLYNNINVIYYPVQRDIEPAILYSITNEISLGPLESTTFTARYTDPLSSGRRVSSDEMIPPAPIIDYNMSRHSGGKGKSLNDYLTVITKNDSGETGTFGYNSCQVTLTNTHTTKGGFVNRFNLRGYGIYMYDPVTLTYIDTTSQGKYGDRPLKYDMYYQQNGNVAQDFLSFFKAHYLNPVTEIESIEFIANISDPLMKAALQCDVGSWITVEETLTGISTNYFVQGYALDISAGGIIKCTLSPLARTDIGGPFGQYENTLFGKIGDTFKFGY